MNKVEFVEKIASKTGATKKDAEQFIAAYHESVLEALSKGDKVQFVGFGTYEPKVRPQRTCRNPQTGAEVVVPKKTVPTMKFSKSISLK